MLTVLVTRASEDTGPGHFCLALHLSHRCRPDCNFTCGPPPLMHSGRVPSHRCCTLSLYGTLQCEVSTVFPGIVEGFTVTVRFSLTDHSVRRRELDHRRGRR